MPDINLLVLLHELSNLTEHISPVYGKHEDFFKKKEVLYVMQEHLSVSYNLHKSWFLGIL